MAEVSLSIALEDVKKYLKLNADYTGDDTYIEGLISLAKNLIYAQTGIEFVEDDENSDEVYKMAILLTVQHFYDNRTSMTDKSVNELPFSMDCLIKLISMRSVEVVEA